MCRTCFFECQVKFAFPAYCLSCRSKGLVCDISIPGVDKTVVADMRVYTAAQADVEPQSEEQPAQSESEQEESKEKAAEDSEEKKEK